MIKMKCPFCKKELRQDYTGVMYCCNEKCKKSADWYGSWVLWEELIRTTQQLKCVTEQFEYVKTFLTKLYMAGTITDEQLERVRQELDKHKKNKRNRTMTETRAKNVQSDTKSRPENVQKSELLKNLELLVNNVFK